MFGNLANNGGGLVVYIKDNLSAIRKHELENHIDESIWLEIRGKGQTFCCNYRPDWTDGQYWTRLNHAIRMGYPINQNIVLTGDLNSDLFKETIEDKLNDHADGRESWSGRMEFLLSCAGYCIGLGNIWRFPYLCYKNGGGTFLIPYFTFLIVGALPMYFRECSLAQFSSRSPISIWAISPILKGTGYGMVTLTTIISVYFNVTMAWVLYYLYHSLTSVLPWSTCDNEWNTEQCYTSRDGSVSSANYSRAGVNSSVSNYHVMFDNATLNTSSITSFNTSQLTEKLTASEEFWRYKVLQISSGVEHMGNIHLGLFVCLCIAWFLTFICVCKGIKVTGKIVYVTVTFPYVVLAILLVRAVTLPGASEGLRFYLIPKWHKLLSTQLWGEAALQIFFTSGMGWGTMLTYASFNKFHHNVYRDSLIVPFMNCGTSIFAGFVTFSILGFIAQEKNVKVDHVVTQGPGLAFVTYPEAISRLPVSPLWSILFFLMLFTVAIDTQFGFVETINTSLIDEYPRFLKSRKIKLSAVLCMIKFLLGIPLIMQIMDWYCALFSLMGFSIVECIVVGWIYGTDQFYKDIEMMLGYQPCKLWSFSWKFSTPCFLLLMLLFNMSTITPVSYKTYTYPPWAIGIGWIIGLSSILPIPVYMIWSMWRTEGSLCDRLKLKLKPESSWGPALDIHRQAYMLSLVNEDKQRDDILKLTKYPEKQSFV